MNHRGSSSRSRSGTTQSLRRKSSIGEQGARTLKRPSPLSATGQSLGTESGTQQGAAAVPKPKPLPPFKNTEIIRKISAGERINVYDLALEIWLHLSEGSRRNILMWWRRRQGRPVRFATLMSGSDAPVRGVGSGINVINTHLPDDGLLVLLVQILACDSDLHARKFQSLNHNPCYVFHKVQEVASDEFAREGVPDAGVYTAVPRDRVDVFASSTSCKQVSDENQCRAGRGSLLSNEDDQGETAVTWRGTRDFMENSTAKLGFGEQVTGFNGGVRNDFGEDFSESACSDDDESEAGAANTKLKKMKTQQALEDSAPPTTPPRRNQNTPLTEIDTDSSSTGELIVETEIVLGMKGHRENVNLICMRTQLCRINWSMAWLIMNSAHFFVPADRYRMFFLWANHVRLGLDQYTVLRRLERCRIKALALEDSLKNLQLDLDWVLFPDDDPEITAEREKLSKKFNQIIDAADTPTKKAGSKKKSEPRRSSGERSKAWAAAEKIYEESGIEWIEPLSTEPRHVGRAGIDPSREDENPHYAMLTTREKVNLRYVEHKLELQESGSKFNAKCGIVLTRSLGRLTKESIKLGRVSCVLPTSKVWLPWKQRCLLCKEKLSLQGFFSHETSTRGLGSTALASIAGNAVTVTIPTALWYILLDEFADKL